jgi:hypothetical protein
MDAYDAYLPCTRNSLILKKSSLFPEILSLLICVGNFAKSRCSAAISLSGLASQTLKIAKFPVKFPVSRELARRRVRSALRRQPATPAFRRAPQENREWAGNTGFSRVRLRLQTPNSATAGRQSAKVSGHTPEYSRFAETVGGDRVRSRLPPAGRSRIRRRLWLKEGLIGSG